MGIGDGSHEAPDVHSLTKSVVLRLAGQLLPVKVQHPVGEAEVSRVVNIRVEADLIPRQIPLWGHILGCKKQAALIRLNSR
jgi:hypothetical protein